MISETLRRAVASIAILLALTAPAFAQLETYLAEDFEGDEAIFPAGKFGEAVYTLDTQGRYIIDGMDATQDSLSALTDTSYYYRLQADCQVLASGAGELAFCGLIFHYGRKNGEDKPSYYVFYVYGDGFYGVKRVLSSGADIVLPLTKTDLLNPAIPNTLAIEAQGSRFNLFINGRPVDSFTDVQIDGGGFGFYISKHTTGAFDNFLVQVEPRRPLETDEPGPSSAESGDGEGNYFKGYKPPLIPKDPSRPLYPWEVGYDKDPKKKKRELEAEHEQATPKREADRDVESAGRKEKSKPAKRPKDDVDGSRRDAGSRSSAGKNKGFIPDEQADDAVPVLPEGEELVEEEAESETAAPSLRPQVSDPPAKLPQAEIEVVDEPVADAEIEPAPEPEPAQVDPAPEEDDEAATLEALKKLAAEFSPPPADAEREPYIEPEPVAEPEPQPSEEELLYRPAPGFEETKEAADAPVDDTPVDEPMAAEESEAQAEPEPAPRDPVYEAKTDYLPESEPVTLDLDIAAEPEAEPAQPEPDTETETEAEPEPVIVEDEPAEDAAPVKNKRKRMDIAGDDWGDPNLRSDSGDAPADKRLPPEEKARRQQEEKDKREAAAQAKADKKAADAAAKAEAKRLAKEAKQKDKATEVALAPAEQPAPIEIDKPAEPEPQPVMVEEEPATDTESEVTDEPVNEPADTVMEGEPFELPDLELPAAEEETVALDPPATETSEPAAAPAADAVIPADVTVDDDFSFKRWTESDNGTTTYAYVAEAYEIENSKAETMAISYQAGTLTAAELSVDVESLGGLDYVGYGLAARFNVSPDKKISYYGLFVSRSGEFMLLRVLDGAEQVLFDWAAAPALKAGGGVNRITLRLSGSTISVLLNGTQVASVQDGDVASGGYALLAGPGTSARYDNLSIVGTEQ